MKYLPFEHIIYTSPFPQDEVMAILSRSVERKTVRIFKNGPTKEYEGIIDGYRFNISRIIRGRNSFQPRITGTVQPDTTGARIEIKMQLHLFVLIFSVFWGLMVAAFLIVDVTSANMRYSYVDTLLPIFMLIIFYLMVILGFKTETKKSRRFFEQLLDAKIILDK